MSCEDVDGKWFSSKTDEVLGALSVQVINRENSLLDTLSVRSSGDVQVELISQGGDNDFRSVIFSRRWPVGVRTPLIPRTKIFMNLTGTIVKSPTF